MSDNNTYWINAWPLTGYYSALIDPIKSKLHQLPNGRWDNHLKLPYWIPESRYLAGIEDYLDVIKDLKVKEYVYVDPITDKPLIRFSVIKGQKAVWDGKIGNGMINLQYTSDLMAYRKRDDGLLGIESITHIDTRLSKSEYKKNPKKFPQRHLPKTDKAYANFSVVLKERRLN